MGLVWSQVTLRLKSQHKGDSFASRDKRQGRRNKQEKGKGTRKKGEGIFVLGVGHKGLQPYRDETDMVYRKLVVCKGNWETPS